MVISCGRCGQAHSYDEFAAIPGTLFSGTTMCPKCYSQIDMLFNPIELEPTACRCCDREFDFMYFDEAESNPKVGGEFMLDCYCHDCEVDTTVYFTLELYSQDTLYDEDDGQMF